PRRFANHLISFLRGSRDPLRDDSENMRQLFYSGPSHLSGSLVQEHLQNRSSGKVLYRRQGAVREPTLPGLFSRSRMLARAMLCRHVPQLFPLRKLPKSSRSKTEAATGSSSSCDSHLECFRSAQFQKGSSRPSPLQARFFCPVAIHAR